MKLGKWEFWQSKKDEKWYFHLKAANGKIILQSEGYNTKKSCKEGITAIKKNAHTVLMIEIKKYENGK